MKRRERKWKELEEAEEAEAERVVKEEERRR